ncbi:hypothetical protein SAMN05216348_103102 [Olsenella sp. KH3B4]|uniref:hypothetical protein n=1 Tax=Olsenella sp. KH3B4 TaxID=1855394 RepID=UPI0008C46D6C|nr:hypothetical protein [Olsenella sp. KH3B4]SES82827.1 hypothetical protein SAMN05216348_103102 [Olsenella sp. KH3B4]
MPSWNIHTAHVERLLREEGAARLGVRDVNAFLFGNVLPDIYVGYMVPVPVARLRDYRETHFADGGAIPSPNYDAFWERFVVGTGAGPLHDLLLGTWAHLVCDSVYNARTRAYIASIGVKAGDVTRKRKQRDFALFGRTFDISLRPRVTPGLIAACAAYPQYPVVEEDVREAVAVAGHIVDENHNGLIFGAPDYDLLTPEFFAGASAEANERIVAGLRRLTA